MRLHVFTKRLDAIEERLGDLPCIVCRDYSPIVETICMGGEESSPRICPSCGRVARIVIRVPCLDGLEDVA